jgi:hypothetical protein
MRQRATISSIVIGKRVNACYPALRFSLPMYPYVPTRYDMPIARDTSDEKSIRHGICPSEEIKPVRIVINQKLKQITQARQQSAGSRIFACAQRFDAEAM